MRTQTDDLHQRFTALLQQYERILFKVAASYCSNKDEREDLVQEMLIQIWRSLPGYDDQSASSTWIYRVCLNTAISYYRKSKARSQRTVLLDDVQDLADLPSGNSTEDASAILDQFIAQLREFDKALIILYLEGTHQKEIAEIMGMTLTNVSTRIGRVKEELKKRINTSK